MRSAANTGAAEASGTTFAGGKLVDHVESDLHHRHHDQLRQAIQRIQREGIVTTVPGGNEYLALVIRIDQAHQVAQHNAMLVSQPERGRIMAASPGSDR
jgi:aspartokinase-like uncharacterized kinase